MRAYVCLNSGTAAGPTVKGGGPFFARGVAQINSSGTRMPKLIMFGGDDNLIPVDILGSNSKFATKWLSQIEKSASSNSNGIIEVQTNSLAPSHKNDFNIIKLKFINIIKYYN